MKLHSPSICIVCVASSAALYLWLLVSPVRDSLTLNGALGAISPVHVSGPTEMLEMDSNAKANTTLNNSLTVALNCRNGSVGPEQMAFIEQARRIIEAFNVEV